MYSFGSDKGNTGESNLARFEGLLSRLKESRAKNRGVSRVRRSDPVREAEQQKRQAEYRANQDRYSGDFEMVGGPGQMYKQVVTGYYNPETGANWSAPHSGYKPKEGTGWVNGYGPTSLDIRPTAIKYGKPGSGDFSGGDFSGSDRPISSIKEKPPTASISGKGKDFEAMLRARMSKF